MIPGTRPDPILRDHRATFGVGGRQDRVVAKMSKIVALGDRDDVVTALA
jgi:hypothetical protein